MGGTWRSVSLASFMQEQGVLKALNGIQPEENMDGMDYWDCGREHTCCQPLLRLLYFIIILYIIFIYYPKLLHAYFSV